MEDWRGQLVGGYRIRERLDEDNLGTIYRAFHPTERTDVVFRVLAGHLSQQKEVLTQVDELAGRLKTVSNPGLLPILHHGIWRDQAYLVTPYVEGPTLRQVITKAGGQMAWSDVVHISRQITHALIAAHEKNVLHLGLRPENVTLSKQGDKYQAVLINVGMARIQEASIVQSYQPEGLSVLAYLSPEQCVASAVSARTDVYALGIMLYEMIAGQLPFHTTTIEQAVSMHMKVQPKRVSQHRIDVPEEIEALVMSMLAKQPRDRPEMAFVADQLKTVRRRLNLPHGSTWDVLAADISPPEPAEPISTPPPEAAAGAGTHRAAGALELHISQRGEATRIVPLGINQRLLLGRESTVDVVLNDRRVSRRHCEISGERDRAIVRDLGSNNGTYLGKTKMLPRQPEELLPGSAIRIPPFTIRLEMLAPVKPAVKQEAAKPEVKESASGAYVSVRLDEKQVHATPGSAPGNLLVRLQNMTNIVDHFSLRIFGIPAEWVTVPARPTQLNPGREDAINLTFHPPPEPTTSAGQHPIQIFVHSREQKSVVDKVDATLVVEPFGRFTTELSPSEVETRTRSTFEATVVNQGNELSEFTLSARDNANALMFEIEPESFDLPPAGSRAVAIKAAPRKPNWIGNTKLHPLTVTVTSTQAMPQTLAAQFKQKAWLPSWLPMLLLILCCALAALAALTGPGLYATLFPTPTMTATPPFTQTPTPSQTPTLTSTPTVTPNATATWQALDSDGDGLLNGDEITTHGTDPFSPDTDGDGLVDGEEVLKYFTNPRDKDSDKDTLLDGEEVQRSLARFGDGGILCPSPSNPDSDADGLVDPQDADPCDLPTPTPSVTPTITPVPDFSLGGQINSNDHLGEMRQAGMIWIKKQIRYGPGDQASNMAEDINEWHTQGFKVLLSVVGHREDLAKGGGYYDQYADFVGGLAELGVEAIEIWNEMNIDREWPTGQISPTAYVDLLARASAQIRARGPGVLVISGAPAPTGVDDGTQVWSDKRYVEGMASAGAARFIDCVGIHYNEGIIAPDKTSGDPRSEHYTRYFWGMVDTYWDAFGGAVPLCFTELGYLSPDGYGQLPSNFAWAQDTSMLEQAEWLGQAVGLASASGKVKFIIVWNVDFTTYGDDPQAGYAIIRADGSCPACGVLQAAVKATQ